MMINRPTRPATNRPRMLAAGLAVLAVVAMAATVPATAHAASSALFQTVHGGGFGGHGGGGHFGGGHFGGHGGHFGGHSHFARHEFHHDRFGWGGCWGGPYYDPYYPYSYCW
jgi:hypothetical protein